MDPVIIIGAGWAGLSAALHLRQAGVPVRVLEAAPQAGGRARRQVLSWPDTDGIALDNGQHLLLGAYRDTLDLVAWLDGQGMDRLPLRIENAAGLQLRRRRHVLAAGTPDSLSRQLAESLSLLAAVLTARGCPGVIACSWSGRCFVPGRPAGGPRWACARWPSGTSTRASRRGSCNSYGIRW